MREGWDHLPNGKDYDGGMRLNWRALGLAAVALFLLIQLVPYGRAHTNPPVTLEAPWPDAASRSLAVRACYDCHSNETEWPWYSNVAPVSWLLQRDVDEGRSKLNYSTWDRPQEADEMAESVLEGEMPPRTYLPPHPAASLNEVEKRQLIAALETLAGTALRERGEQEDDGEEGDR
jgi:hypothetical protein